MRVKDCVTLVLSATCKWLKFLCLGLHEVTVPGAA